MRLAGKGQSLLFLVFLQPLLFRTVSSSVRRVAESTELSKVHFNNQLNICKEISTEHVLCSKIHTTEHPRITRASSVRDRFVFPVRWTRSHGLVG